MENTELEKVIEEQKRQITEQEKQLGRMEQTVRELSIRVEADERCTEQGTKQLSEKVDRVQKTCGRCLAVSIFSSAMLLVNLFFILVLLST